LQVVESLFAIFLMVITVTSFQNPPCIALNKIGLISVSEIPGSEAAPAPALFQLGAPAAQVF
jgi:hypothetical protein